MQPILSKTDFQLPSSYAKKLVCKKTFYQTANDTNEYMEMDEGGYIVGRMASMLYPEGIEIAGSTQYYLRQTEKLMLEEEAILFEPAFFSKWF